MDLPATSNARGQTQPTAPKEEKNYHTFDLIMIDQISRVIIDEMKELRRLGDLANGSFLETSLLGSMVDRDAQRLRNTILSCADLYPVSSPEHALPRSIFVPFHKNKDVDLAARRQSVANEFSISPRTVVRLEEKFIEYFAQLSGTWVLEDRAVLDRAKLWFKQRRNVPSEPVKLAVDDLPSLVGAQALALNTLGEQIESLRMQLAGLVKANQKMAKMLGK